MSHLQSCGLLCAAAAGTCLMANVALATENSALEYPIGVNTIFAGVLPPPGGSVWLQYNQFYSAGRVNGPDGRSLVPGFNINVVASATRVLHTWDVQLGPFTLTSGAVQPFAYIGGKVPGAKDQSFGLGDFTLQPLYLGYSNPAHNLFAYAGLDIFFPTGAYDKGHLFNQGENVYTFAPEALVTFQPMPKLQLDAAAVFEIHTKNPATQYRSGTTFNLDYGLTYGLSDRLEGLSFGVQGYFLQQVSDDTVNRARVLPDGFRGRSLGIGPQIFYAIDKAGGVLLKYQHEFLVQNRPAGDRVWVQWAVPF